MASPNGLFQAFIELTVNDVELEFIATVNISQNGSASTPVVRGLVKALLPSRKVGRVVSL